MGDGQLKRAGLVGTNSMRSGANRRVLDVIAKDGGIFNAWDDEPWVIKGVAVRVSLICFSKDREEQKSQLDGHPVERIGSDLIASRSDVTTARPLSENRGIAFMGDTKGGAFDVSGDLARQWLQLPLNPNGQPNSDVLRPWLERYGHHSPSLRPLDHRFRLGDGRARSRPLRSAFRLLPHQNQTGT
jgi:type II restriction/modification system DNA methylase subunit YeeA